MAVTAGNGANSGLQAGARGAGQGMLPPAASTCAVDSGRDAAGAQSTGAACGGADDDAALLADRRKLMLRLIPWVGMPWPLENFLRPL